jgi:hypothetical protein
MNEAARLRTAIEQIKRATVEGRICDDVAWFDKSETLHDFCERTLAGEDSQAEAPLGDRCRVRDDRFVEPCEFLGRAIQSRHGPFHRGGGIVLHNLVRLDTLKASRTFVTVRSGEWKAKGIVLNFCPFCGTQIDAPVAKQQDEKAA